MDVSRETETLLGEYASLLRKWNPRINLVAPSTLPDLEERHLRDCLQVASLALPQSGTWVDLGSGGGLPGIVMSVAARSTDTDFILVESDGRKAAFLRTVVRELGLEKTQVVSSRIESLDPLKAAYISARALAPLPRLMPYLTQHLAQGGQAWLMKGRQWQEEVNEAAVSWRFSFEAHSSITDNSAAILKIWGIDHV